MDFVLERWNPIGIVLVDVPCEVDEGLFVLLGLYRADRYGCTAHGRRASGCFRPAPVKELKTPKSATISCQRPKFSNEYDPSMATLERQRSDAGAKSRGALRARQGRCDHAEGRREPDARPQCAEHQGPIGPTCSARHCSAMPDCSAAMFLRPAWLAVIAGLVGRAFALSRRIVHP